MRKASIFFYVIALGLILMSYNNCGESTYETPGGQVEQSSELSDEIVEFDSQPQALNIVGVEPPLVEYELNAKTDQEPDLEVTIRVTGDEQDIIAVVGSACSQLIKVEEGRYICRFKCGLSGGAKEKSMDVSISDARFGNRRQLRRAAFKCRRKIKAAAAPNPKPKPTPKPKPKPTPKPVSMATVQIYRHYSSKHRDYQYTRSATSPSGYFRYTSTPDYGQLRRYYKGIDLSSSQQGEFKLFAKSASGRVPLYNCRVKGLNKHYVSLSSSCEGHGTRVGGILGYGRASKAEGPLNQRIYRCFKSGLGHIVVFGTNCGSYNTSKGSLGFAAP